MILQALRDPARPFRGLQPMSEKVLGEFEDLVVPESWEYNDWEKDKEGPYDHT